MPLTNEKITSDPAQQKARYILRTPTVLDNDIICRRFSSHCDSTCQTNNVFVPISPKLVTSGIELHLPPDRQPTSELGRSNTFRRCATHNLRMPKEVTMDPMNFVSYLVIAPDAAVLF